MESMRGSLRIKNRRQFSREGLKTRRCSPRMSFRFHHYLQQPDAIARAVIGVRRAKKKPPGACDMRSIAFRMGILSAVIAAQLVTNAAAALPVNGQDVPALAANKAVTPPVTPATTPER
jgi:hypothetical protein